MSDPTAPVQFRYDDAGYLRWLAANPNGYVVNSNNPPVSDYLRLHRASCETINNPTTRNWTTTGYMKTCSTEHATLASWAQESVGGPLQPCESCKPVPGVTLPSRTALERTAPSKNPRISRIPPSPSSESTRDFGTTVPSISARILPSEIDSGCPELDRAWKSYASMILNRSRILIPDTDDDLTWHAFLGHSIDMQGFRAAEFCGVDELTRTAPKFVPLKSRGIDVPELASLWEVAEIRRHLLARNDDVPLEATLNVLRTHGGPSGESLAEAFHDFPWRKFHWSVRALLENSKVLEPFGFSFRRWLADACDQLGVEAFPPRNFRQPVTDRGAKSTLEWALREQLKKAFCMVGPAMSAYMLCDWQLWLWREGRTAVFATFKLDSFHEAFVKKFGRGGIPASETGFTDWWFRHFPELPPRLANECIWLAVENKQVSVW